MRESFSTLPQGPDSMLTLSKPLFSDFWYTLAKSKCLYLIKSSSLLKSMNAGGGGDTLIVGDLGNATRSVIPQGFAVNRRGENNRAFVDGAPIKATMTTMAVAIRRFMLWRCSDLCALEGCSAINSECMKDYGIPGKKTLGEAQRVFT